MKPDYISDNIKKVNEVDMKEILREIKRKNKEFRDSFHYGPDVMNFKCAPKR